MTEEEKTLLAGCRRGEKAAWDALVLQYSNPAYSTIRSTLTLHHTLPQDDIVEDLHQDFFLGLCENDFRKLRQFRGDHGCTLASWLRVIASRLTIDFLRKHRATQTNLTDEVLIDWSDPSDRVNDETRASQLRQVLQELPPRDRLLLTLTYQKDLPPDEVAAILRVSLSAIYTQKSRALAKLRESLRKSEIS